MKPKHLTGLALLEHAVKLKKALDQGKKLEMYDHSGSTNWTIHDSIPAFTEPLEVYRVHQPWIWPNWLMGEWLVRTHYGTWVVSPTEPQSHGIGIEHGGWVFPSAYFVISDRVQIDWPEYEVWRESKTAKADCRTVLRTSEL